MLTDLPIGLIFGYAGIVLSLLSTFMRRMQPLRMVAIAGNITGLVYGYIDAVWPTFVGNLLLLPINGYRLWEIQQLSNSIRKAHTGDSLVHMLLPHMTRQQVQAGTPLFNAGEPADMMYYLARGQIKLVEIDKVLTDGSMIGEVGLFARHPKRTISAHCLTDCDLYDLSQEKLFALYFQSPTIGFNLVQLLVENLLERRPPPRPAPPPDEIRHHS